jgi:hypothetical protein
LDAKTKNTWKDKQFARNFLENFASKNEISTPSIWGRITADEIAESGGKALLKLYNYSMKEMLQAIYSGIEYLCNHSSPKKLTGKKNGSLKQFQNRIGKIYQIKEFLWTKSKILLISKNQLIGDELLQGY